VAGKQAVLERVQLKPVQLVEGRWVEAAWYQLSDRTFSPSGSYGRRIMRTDPPVTTPYLYATYILDYIKTLVIKLPQGLRAANEKCMPSNSQT